MHFNIQCMQNALKIHFEMHVKNVFKMHFKNGEIKCISNSTGIKCIY
jgi:hypothetical protein